MLRRALLFGAPLAILLFLPVAHFMGGQSSLSAEDPFEVLNQYLEAIYARDFKEAYRYISSTDQRLKEERRYVRQHGAFSGFTLDLGRKLSGFIEATPVGHTINGDRATVKLKLHLPDSNGLSGLLLDWDEQQLNSLAPLEQRKLIERLDQRHGEGKIPWIEGEESFELVKESRGWRIFLNWAAGVRIAFGALAPPSTRLQAQPVDREILIHPGELFTAAFRVKNPSDRELSTRISHRVEPESVAEHLDLVECGLMFPVRLLPQEEMEYSSTYLLRGDLPDKIRRLQVTYEFKVDE